MQREELNRRFRERSDAIIHDMDIDLDQERSRAQRGFRDHEQPQRSSNAERYNHINDVEHTHTAHYGTVEAQSDSVTTLVRPDTAKTDLIRKSVQRSTSEVLRDALMVGATALTLDRSYNSEVPRNPRSEIISKGIEAEVSQRAAATNGEIGEQGERIIEKHGYRVGKFAAIAAAEVVSDVKRIKKGTAPIRDAAAAGTISRSEKNAVLLDQTKKTVLSSGKKLGGVILEGVKHDVEDLQLGDDLGTQALTKPKDIVVGAKRTIGAVSFTTTASKKAATKISSAAQSVRTWASNFFKKLSTTPVGKKATVVLIGIAAAALLLLVIISIPAVLSSMMMKSEETDINEAYHLITKLDADLQEQIYSWAEIPSDEFRFFLNGTQVSSVHDLQVYTEIEPLLAYLDSKFSDYKYGDVAGDISLLHSALYSAQYRQWFRYETTVIDEEEVTVTITVTDISLNTTLWEDYYEANKDTLLEVSQQEQYETLLGVGVYTFRTSWGSPFPSIDWSQHISDRWGWRIHPITGEKQDHQGLDIALPEGTPIHAVHDGKVDLSTSEELGNYVTLKDGRNRSIYAHMHSFAVEDGQRVKVGDVIGYVGSSGNSTGNHLHIVCEVNGKNICPLLMLSCEVVEEE